MPEVILNEKLAEVLSKHGIETTVDNEFIYPALNEKVKLKARATYEEINNYISSRLDVMIMAETGEKIIECFGDFGRDIESAISNNLLNFNLGTLHPLLAAFGCKLPGVLNYITIEEWELDGKIWSAYIGNLVPKTNAKNPAAISPPEQFYNKITNCIRSQVLNNNLHWFRGYYLQSQASIAYCEFLMDNQPISNSNSIFLSLPIIPDAEVYSCRNFIIIKRHL